MAISKYNLDINKQAIMKPVVILRQGDYGIDTMQVSLSVANEPMDLTGATIKFMGTTAGGKQIIDDVHVKIIDAKGGVFEYVFPSEAASDIGGYRVAYFSIIQANGQSSTMDFRVQVLSGVDLSAPAASDYVSHYDTMVSTLNSAYDSATAATNTKMAAAVSSVATSAATVLNSALSNVATVNSQANNASSTANKAVSMASSVASTVTSQATYINSVASSAAADVNRALDKLNNISIGGRNLVLGTSTNIVKANDWNMTVANIKNDKSLGGNVTASVMINNADHASELQRGSAQIILDALDATGNILKSTKGANVSYNASGISWCSISFDDNTTTIRVRIQTLNMMANAYYSRLKVEKGNIPTDWTPAPEDADNTFLKKANQLPAEARDFNYLASHMQTYQGTWWNGGEPVLNAPTDNWTWSSIEIVAGNGEQTGVIRTMRFGVGDVYSANVNGGVLRGWKLIANDANVVHKSGDTMTGGLKGGQTILPDSGDLNALTDTGKYYQAKTINVVNWKNRPANAPNFAFSVDVIGNGSQSLGTQVYYVHTTNRMWVRTIWLDGSIKGSDWAELANDANVVHKTDNETVAGDKTFTGNVTIPKNKVTVNTAYGTFTLTKTLDIVHIQAHVSKDIPDNINVPNVVPQGFRPDGVSVPMTFIHGLDNGVIAVNPDGSLYTSSNIVPNTSFLAASWAVAGN